MTVKTFRAYLALDVSNGDMRLTKTVPGARQHQVVVRLEVTANLPEPVTPTLVMSIDVPSPVVEAVSGHELKAAVTPPAAPAQGVPESQLT